MKIGILTWFYGSNYGAKAQSYALQQILKSIGHEVFMIDYRTPGYEECNKSMNYNYPNIKWHPVRKYYCMRRDKTLQAAIGMFNLSEKVYDSSDINALDLDAIIFGSDAIFNVKHPFFNDVYMGVDINTKKIGFSPSCENLSPDYILSSKQIASIEEFHAISVRDENTQKLIKNNCGLNTRITLDPTFLYDFVDVETKWIYRDYILVYSFSDWNKYSEEMRRFANKINKKILSVGRYCNWADINIEDASFAQWVVSFKYAEYVFTDSFHGTVFAIKNLKDLILVCRDDKKAKIQSILNDVKAEITFYNDGSIDKYLCANRMNKDTVAIAVEQLRICSINYLVDAIR